MLQLSVHFFTMKNQNNFNTPKVFLINGKLTIVYLEHFGGKPFIHIEIGDDRHIYFRQLRRYHTVRTFDELNDDLVESWAENSFSYNLKCSCKIKVSDN